MFGTWMNKPISIAMFISVLIHLALFSLMSFLLSGRFEPSSISRILVLNLQFSHTEDMQGRDVFDDRTVNNEPVSEAQRSEGIEATNHEAAATAAAKEMAGITNRGIATGPERITPIVGDQVTSDVDRTDMPTDVPTEIAPSRDTEYDLLTADDTSEPSETSSQFDAQDRAEETVALSFKQEKMLKRKFREWAENYYRLDEAQTGVRWTHGGQEYVADFKELPAVDDMGLEYVIVEISTEENGTRLSSEVTMKRLSFSNFAQFIDRWDPDILMHNDEMDGRFHSNSKISLSYSRRVRPQFHGKVTTSSRGINIVNARGYLKRERIFLGGYETGVRKIRLPKHFAPFPGGAPLRHEQLHRLEGDTRLRFYGDGTYGWTDLGSGSSEQIRFISEDPVYIVGAPKTKLHIRGVVKGRVLVYSPERIVIEGDLTYARNPDLINGADDYLGLVSDKYVDIAKPDVTGPGDLEIYASIYAKRRFAVKAYRTRGNALLSVYGSVSAGSLSATEPRYNTKITFDKRLENLRPPGYPMTNRYEIDSWDDHWRVN